MNILDCSNDVAFFWHLTDLHVDLNYGNRSTGKCNGSYGDYQCDSSPTLGLSAINVTRRFSVENTPPDFVIWSGDNGPHINGLPEGQLLTGLRLISNQLQRVFPVNEVYVLPVVGNHDVAPANSMRPLPSDSKRLSWCHQLASDTQLWGPWIHLRNASQPINKSVTEPPSPQSAPPFANFSKGCFYSHLLHLPGSNLLLISVNGLVWYTGNPQADDSVSDPLGQLKWLQETFQWARETNIKVLLVSHFPPGASENSPAYYRHLRPVFNQPFVRLLRKNADVLMAGLFAHSHVDSFRVLSGENGQPIASLFTLPSVSPLHLSGLGSLNPRIRRFRYNRSSGKLLGYSQYFLNLSLPQVLDSPDPLWQLEYDTSDAYQLSDLSPSSLAALLDVFERDDSPDGAWSRYWSYELGGRPHDPVPEILTPDGLCPHINSKCRCQHLCAMRYLEYEELDLCLTECLTISPSLSGTLFNAVVGVLTIPPTLNTSELDEPSHTSDQRSSLPIVAGVIIAFLAILVGVVLIVNREICRNRRRYARRFVDGESVGDVVFTTIDGPTILLNGGSGYLPADDMDRDVQTGSSRTELRADFHPAHRMDDDNPSNPLDASYHSDSRNITINKLGTLLLSPHTYSRCGDLEYSAQISTTKVDDRAFSGSGFSQLPPHTPNGVIPDMLRESRRSYFTPRSSEIRGDDPKVPVDSTIKDDGSTPGRIGAYSFVCPSEDYYADDEAFGDDDDALQQADEGGSLSAVEDDELSRNGSQSFYLDEGRVPLTKLKPTHDWRLLKKRGKGSIQSFGDPVYPCRMSAATTVGQSLPSLNHGHSISHELQLSPSELAPNSRSADAAVSPTNCKSPYTNLPDQNVRTIDTAITNGVHAKCATNESPSYDYVRI